jgi:hypothetical protein
MNYPETFIKAKREQRILKLNSVILKAKAEQLKLEIENTISFVNQFIEYYKNSNKSLIGNRSKAKEHFAGIEYGFKELNKLNQQIGIIETEINNNKLEYEKQRKLILRFKQEFEK